MLNLGIIGINEGNGHPYSYSSIFNGFNEDLLHLCPMQIIRDYLIQIHKNENIISDATVTHIWTQDYQQSFNIAQLTNIKNVVTSLDDLILNVDAVIIARDDIENHYNMAKRVIERGIPLFIDKCITDDFNSLNRLLSLGNRSKIMATSSSRYTPIIYDAKNKLKICDKHYIHGVSKISWIRYANHLLDGICYLFGTEFLSIQNISSDNQIDIMHIVFKHGLECILTIKEDMALPISFTVYNDQQQLEIPFTDTSLSSYFFGFYNMLDEFTKFVKDGSSNYEFSDSIKITSLIIMGELSKRQNNRKIFFDEELLKYSLT